MTNRLHSLLKGRLVKYATDLWACSREAGVFFYSKAILGSNRFRIIPNTIDTGVYAFCPSERDRLRSEFGIADSLVLGNVARLDPEKNHSLLLDIFASVRKQNSSAILLIIGQGRLENDLKDKAKALSLTPYVRFLGERHDVPALYSAMDAFILPSHFEGLPMTLVEAQASGLPCFTSREAVPPEAAVTPLLTFLSLNDSPESWAEAIQDRAAENSTPQREDAQALMRQTKWDITQAAALLETLF